MLMITAILQPFKLDDGEICVTALQQAIRIRSGETGTHAI
jgi:nitrogen regulatory protein PII